MLVVFCCVGSERKVRKKRRLVIDELKSIASETMKMQLSDTSEIVSTLDLAPPTKKLMHWKETGGVEKLFAFPGRQIVSKKLSRVNTTLCLDDGSRWWSCFAWSINVCWCFIKLMFNVSVIYQHFYCSCVTDYVISSRRLYTFCSEYVFITHWVGNGFNSCT